MYNVVFLHISYAFAYEFSFAFIFLNISPVPSSNTSTLYIFLSIIVVTVVLSSIFTIKAFSFLSNSNKFEILIPIGVIEAILFFSSLLVFLAISDLFADTCIALIFLCFLNH